MEEQHNHLVRMLDRKQLTVTEVIDVDSFNLNDIELKTGHGNIAVKGRNMHVKKLNLERGEVDIEGEIDSIVYGVRKTSDKGFKRLFG